MQFLSRKKRSSSCEWGGSTHALTVLISFNAVKLEKIITCVSAHTLLFTLDSFAIILCLDSSDLIRSHQLSHIKRTMKVALTLTRMAVHVIVSRVFLPCLCVYTLDCLYGVWLFAACPDLGLLLDYSFFLPWILLFAVVLLRLSDYALY